MTTSHNQSDFNPNKWNYSHTVHLTNGKTLFLIHHNPPSDLKELADTTAEYDQVSIRLISEILPDGEVVQELNLESGKYERFIAHSTAQAKRRSLVAPVEAIASVVATEPPTSSRVTHADVGDDEFNIKAACGNSFGEMRSYYWVDTLAEYKAAVHAMNRCRNCEQALAGK